MEVSSCLETTEVQSAASHSSLVHAQLDCTVSCLRRTNILMELKNAFSCCPQNSFEEPQPGMNDKTCGATYLKKFSISSDQSHEQAQCPNGGEALTQTNGDHLTCEPGQYGCGMLHTCQQVGTTYACCPDLIGKRKQTHEHTLIHSHIQSLSGANV